MAAKKELVAIQQQIAEQAARAGDSAEASASGALRITQSKKFVHPLEPEKSVDGPIEVIVVDYCATNGWFPRIFDPSNPEPPDCYAIGGPASIGGPEADPRNLVASEKSLDRQAADGCAGCVMNQWDSHPSGRGKACKNRRLLAVITDLEGDPAEVPIYTVSVMPTAIKRWDAYQTSLGAKGAIPVCVVTRLSLDPSSDYSSLMFEAAEPNPNLGAHMGRQEEARRILATEPTYPAPEEKAAAPKRAVRKKTTKKKARRRAA